MAKISTHPIASLLEIAERWKKDCLTGDGSLFSKAHLLTPENINQFKKYFVAIVQGSIEDTFNDVLYDPILGEKVRAEYGDEVYSNFKNIGITKIRFTYISAVVIDAHFMKVGNQCLRG